MLRQPKGMLTLNDAVVHALVDGEVLLLNVETGVYFGLDGVGADIWELAVQGLSEDDIVDRLLDEYDVDPEALRVDVDAFLQQLADKGLIRIGAG